MQYDLMVQDLAKLSSHHEAMLEILSETIGFEYTEALFKPFYEHILPSRNSLEAEEFLKAVEAIAAKLFFLRDGINNDELFSKIENYVHDFEPQK